MDEVNIRSSLLQSAIAGIIRKVVKGKTGYNPQIQFNDAITVTFDGDKAKMHLNLDAELDKADLEALIKKLI
jgi:hypothetical protein